MLVEQMKALSFGGVDLRWYTSIGVETLESVRLSWDFLYHFITTIVLLWYNSTTSTSSKHIYVGFQTNILCGFSSNSDPNLNPCLNPNPGPAQIKIKHKPNQIKIQFNPDPRFYSNPNQIKSRSRSSSKSRSQSIPDHDPGRIQIQLTCVSSSDLPPTSCRRQKAPWYLMI